MGERRIGCCWSEEEARIERKHPKMQQNGPGVDGLFCCHSMHFAQIPQPGILARRSNQSEKPMLEHIGDLCEMLASANRTRPREDCFRALLVSLPVRLWFEPERDPSG
jgi:hypothetical protein